MKLCYYCNHFDLRTAQEDYSDVTPGNDFEMICYKNHWRFDAFTATIDEFRKNLETANTCKDFEERK